LSRIKRVTKYFYDNNIYSYAIKKKVTQLALLKYSFNPKSYDKAAKARIKERLCQKV